MAHPWMQQDILEMSSNDSDEDGSDNDIDDRDEEWS
jgi:hypothetical protein